MSDNNKSMLQQLRDRVKKGIVAATSDNAQPAEPVAVVSTSTPEPKIDNPTSNKEESPVTTTEPGPRRRTVNLSKDALRARALKGAETRRAKKANPVPVTKVTKPTARPKNEKKVATPALVKPAAVSGKQKKPIQSGTIAGKRVVFRDDEVANELIRCNTFPEMVALAKGYACMNLDKLANCKTQFDRGEIGVGLARMRIGNLMRGALARQKQQEEKEKRANRR